MLADVSSTRNNRFLMETLPINSKSIVEAIQLLKLWLLKRNLSQGFGSFDSFLLNNFIAYLILNKQINSHMSQYQIFRIVLLTLSEANWHTNGLNLNDLVEEKLDDETKSKHNVDMSNFHKHYQVVFIDSTGYLNISARMSKNTFLMAKHEASVSLRQLNDDLYDCFENLFIVEHQFEFRFDSLISLNADSLTYYNDLVKKFNKQDELVDYLNEGQCVAVRNLEDLLNRALEQRTSLIFAKLIEAKRWSIYTKPQNDQEPVLFGILFNEKYESILIKGPMSNTADGAEFRKFWGPKSELRRFQDTSICEAVVFEASNVASKRLIYSEIVKYILKYHLSIDESNIKFCDRQLNSILSLPKGVAENYGTGEEKLADSIKMFDEFSRIIKDLHDLPLSIVNLQGISPSFRYTQTFSPLPCGFKYDKDTANNIQAKMGRKLVPKYPPGPVLAPYVPHLDVLLMLESSGKWPNDLDCIRRLKTAFYLKINEILKANHNIMSFTNVEYLDVLYKGYVFRLSIFTMHELICMKSAPNEQGIIMTVETLESVNYERTMIYLPKITNALHA
jgi:U3 small nucleolar RNA-associated protein 22